MGQVDTRRIYNPEEKYTFVGYSLDRVIKEIDSRLTASDCWATITRVDDLISKIEYFSDAAKTQKKIERTFTRTTGSDTVDYITGIITIFYNDDGSEDSRVTTVITRDAEDLIVSCENVFSTSEVSC